MRAIIPILSKNTGAFISALLPFVAMNSYLDGYFVNRRLIYIIAEIENNDFKNIFFKNH